MKKLHKLIHMKLFIQNCLNEPTIKLQLNARKNVKKTLKENVRNPQTFTRKISLFPKIG